MSRWIAGAFDPARRLDAWRLAASLSPHEATVVEAGELRAIHSGPPTHERAPLCLFDGHLDNAAELRRDLTVASTDSVERGLTPAFSPLELDEAAAGEGSPGADEQLIAGCYRRWGRALLPRLRGDFVLLIWDRDRREGLLARDQLGVQPCFLSEVEGQLRFASEIRHLLALLPQRPAPDRAGIAHWLAASARPGTGTLYEGIERLMPGTALLFGRDGIRRWRYWAPRFEEPLELPRGELAERIRTGIGEAVRRRLDPTGVTGVLMSGGLDSSAIAAIAARVPGADVEAYSATFPEHPDTDESDLIAQLCRELDLPRLGAVVRPGGLLAGMLESIAQWQMPQLGWGDFWALPLMRAAASQGMRVMLDGDGGDELFGVRSYLLADCLSRGRLSETWSLAHRLPGAASGPSRRQVAAMVGSRGVVGALPYGLHTRLARPFAARGAPDWLRPALAREMARTDDPSAWKRLDGPRWWAHAAYGLTRGIEQAGIFEHQSRRAAQAGLAARHPLLDLDLVKLGLRQPPRQTLDPRFNRPLLRTAMSGLLPDTVRLRAGKARFEPVIVDCLRGTDAPAVRQLLSDRHAQIGAYVDLARVRHSLLDSEQTSKTNEFRWMWQVWRLLNAECWLRAQDGSLEGIELDGTRLSAPNIAIDPVRLAIPG
jgi:asparagine synthase (glutamine-hydrolysing)